MAELASNAGYDHPDRIRADIGKATEWFYSYANEQKVLRAYAFELWEGYYVGLYLFLASGLSCAVLLVLAYFFPSAVLCAFAGLCAMIFLASWAVRRWATFPKILNLPTQQIAQIRASSEVLAEAKKRFG